MTDFTWTGQALREIFYGIDWVLSQPIVITSLVVLALASLISYAMG
jgi:bacteriorhodopsin